MRFFIDGSFKTLFQNDGEYAYQNYDDVGVDDFIGIIRPGAVQSRGDIPQQENDPGKEDGCGHARVNELILIGDFAPVDPILNQINKQVRKESCFEVLKARFGGAAENCKNAIRKIFIQEIQRHKDAPKGQCFPCDFVPEKSFHGYPFLLAIQTSKNHDTEQNFVCYSTSSFSGAHLTHVKRFFCRKQNVHSRICLEPRAVKFYQGERVKSIDGFLSGSNGSATDSLVSGLICFSSLVCIFDT